ncbi:MAG: ABC transporter substrate-binding protein [Flavobacteriales bacterium]|nr:ABC transporter substrate-binding protein [Flavobacteriales bacterium]
MRCAIAYTAVAMLAGCGTPTAHDGGSEGPWVPIPLEHALHFRLWQRGADHAALVLGAGGDADTIGRFLIADMKNPSSLPWRGDYAVLPATSPRAVIMSTTHLPFMDALGTLGNVLASAWPERSRSATVQEALAAGRLVPLFQNTEARREQLVAISPDVVLDHPFGHTRPPTDLAGTWVPIGEYLEEHPLARAEWIRFFGVLFGHREKADSLYFAIAERYSRTAALVAPSTHHPEVFFGSAWQGTWNVPPGNSYMARLIQDAGGEYLYAGQMAQGNLDLHMETVLADAHRADHWGMIVDVPRLIGRADLPGMDARLSTALSIGQGQLFVANSAEADLFGLALLEPEIALADLIAIFHRELLPDHEPVYYRPLIQ